MNSGIRIKKGFTWQKFSDRSALCKIGNSRQGFNEVPSKPGVKRQKGKSHLRFTTFSHLNYRKRKERKSLSDTLPCFNCHFLQPQYKIICLHCLTRYLSGTSHRDRASPTVLHPSLNWASGFERIILQRGCEGWSKSRRMLGSRSAERPELKTSLFNDLTLLRTMGNHSRWATELRGLKGNPCPGCSRTTAGEAPKPPGWIHFSINVFSTLSPMCYYQKLFKSGGLNSHRASAPHWQLQQF